MCNFKTEPHQSVSKTRPVGSGVKTHQRLQPLKFALPKRLIVFIPKQVPWVDEKPTLKTGTLPYV